MAKYCTNCGKELKDGVPCDCKKDALEEIKENEMVKGIVETFKNMFTKPVDTIKSYTKAKNFVPSMILVGIMSILTGIFAMALMKGVEETLSDLVSSILGGLTTSLYSMGSYTSLDIPYGQIFITFTVVAFILSFVFAGILYLVNTVMFKGKENFKGIYSLYGVTTVITSAALALSIILSFINTVLALLVFVLGSLLSLVYMIKGIKYIGPKDENKHGYIYIITMAFYLVALFIIMKIFVS